MEQFSLAGERQLAWVQPKTFQRSYELRAGEAVVAILEFKSAFGSLALAVTADERWTFKRMGFFNPRVTVRREGEEADLAVYRPHWTGNHGSLVFAGGRTYHWKAANFWATRYILSGSDGKAWVTYQSGAVKARAGNLFKSQALVAIDPAVVENEDLPVLVLAGWYLILLQQEDSTAVAATAAVS